MPDETPQSSNSSGLAPNVAGLLAYLFLIPAILFLVLEPYNKNPFIRFHCFQALAICVVSIVVQVVLNTTIGMLGLFALAPLAMLVSLGILALVIMCMVKAYNNQKMIIPFISDFANQQAG
jgi:uncharacterized membrane protein